VPYKAPGRVLYKTIYIPVAYQDEWERFAALAKRTGRSLSVVVSEAITFYQRQGVWMLRYTPDGHPVSIHWSKDSAEAERAKFSTGAPLVVEPWPVMLE